MGDSPASKTRVQTSHSIVEEFRRRADVLLDKLPSRSDNLQDESSSSRVALLYPFLISNLKLGNP